MARMKMSFSLSLMFVLLGLPGSSLAQIQSTTAVTGTVTDRSGAVLPGVQVTVRNEATGGVRETITNDLDYYSVQSLRPGEYSITAALSGFKTAVVTERELLVSIPGSVKFCSLGGLQL